MAKESIFRDDWHASLCAHYMDVVRRDDQKTLRTLTDVMYEVGFSERELAELRVRATMRADDMPEDFVPDMQILEPQEDVGTRLVVSVPEISDAYQPVEEPLAEAEAVEELQGDTPPDEPEDKDSPQQLSLF